MRLPFGPKLWSMPASHVAMFTPSGRMQSRLFWIVFEATPGP